MLLIKYSPFINILKYWYELSDN